MLGYVILCALLSSALVQARPASFVRPRLTLAEEWTSYQKFGHNGPGTYIFGYDVEDPKTGNIQFRQEEKFKNGTIVGSYGLVEPDGNVRITHYVADERGYRTMTENSLKKTVHFPPVDQKNDLRGSHGFATQTPQLQMSQIKRQPSYGRAPLYEQRTPPKYAAFAGGRI